MLQLLEGRHESKTLVEQTANYLHMGNTCVYTVIALVTSELVKTSI